MRELGPFTLATGGGLRIGEYGCIRVRSTVPISFIAEAEDGKTLLIRSKEKAGRVKGRILYGKNGSIRFCVTTILKHRHRLGRSILEMTLSLDHHHPHISVTPVANVSKGQKNGA